MAIEYRSSVETFDQTGAKIFAIIPLMRNKQFTVHVTTEQPRAREIANLLKADSNTAHIEVIEYHVAAREGWDAPPLDERAK